MPNTMQRFLIATIIVTITVTGIFISNVPDSVYANVINTANTNRVILDKKINDSIKKYSGIKNAVSKKIQVPGLNYTYVNGIRSNNMCPQGFCIAGDYLLLTAYDMSKRTNSAIYVLNKSGKYIATIDLSRKGHVGGITYDSKRKEVIVACSNGGNNYYWVTYNNLKKAINGNKKITLKSQAIENKASAITYYDGKLWVATFSSSSNKTEVRSYNASYRKNNACPIGKKITIKGKKIQGITFVSKNRMLISSSYGKKNYSYLHEYNVSSNTAKLIRSVKLPSLSQNIAYSGGKLYVLFESGAYGYRSGARDPLDKLLVLNYKQVK